MITERSQRWWYIDKQRDTDIDTDIYSMRDREFTSSLHCVTFHWINELLPVHISQYRCEWFLVTREKF